MKSLIPALGVLATVLVMLSTPAQAATIQVQFTGLNAFYNGFDIYDAGAQAGGSQNPAQADPLTSISFLVDGTPVGTLATQIYADFAIVGVNNLPVGGGTVGSGFGGFLDVLTNDSGWGLGLDFNAFQITYNSGTGVIAATGTAAFVSGQALPFGLVAGPPVQVSLLLNGLTNVGTSGGFVTRFTAAGNGQITATSVPEPASLLLTGTAVAALIVKRRRRRAGPMRF